MPSHVAKHARSPVCHATTAHVKAPPAAIELKRSGVSTAAGATAAMLPSLLPVSTPS